MDKGNWVRVDKRLAALLPKNEPYTIIDAVLSFTIDRDNKKPYSINGYAQLWGWSRSKTRRFIRTLEAGQDYFTDNHETGQRTGARQGKRHPIRLIISKLQVEQDRAKDRGETGVVDTTNKPIKNKPKPKDKRCFIPPTLEEVVSYCMETKSQVNARKWFNHYEAVGWKMGRSKMVDWQAAVRTWEDSEFGGSNGKGNNGSRGTGQTNGYSSGARGLGDGEAYPVDCEVTE